MTRDIEWRPTPSLRYVRRVGWDETLHTERDFLIIEQLWESVGLPRYTEWRELHLPLPLHLQTP